MNISTLEQYVEQRNQIRTIFKERPLSLLNPKDRQTLADDLSCALSPENLTCDGELSRSQVQRKYQMLARVRRELESIDPQLEFYE